VVLVHGGCSFWWGLCVVAVCGSCLAVVEVLCWCVCCLFDLLPLVLVGVLFRVVDGLLEFVWCLLDVSWWLC